MGKFHIIINNYQIYFSSYIQISTFSLNYYSSFSTTNATKRQITQAFSSKVSVFLYQIMFKSAFYAK